MARSSNTRGPSAQPFTERRLETREFVKLFDYVMLLLCVTALLSALSRDHYLPSIGAVTSPNHARVEKPATQPQAVPNR